MWSFSADSRSFLHSFDFTVFSRWRLFRCAWHVLSTSVFSVYVFGTFGNKLQLSLLMRLYFLLYQKKLRATSSRHAVLPLASLGPSLRVALCIRGLVLLCLLGKLLLYLSLNNMGCCVFSSYLR